MSSYTTSFQEKSDDTLNFVKYHWWIYQYYDFSAKKKGKNRPENPKKKNHNFIPWNVWLLLTKLNIHELIIEKGESWGTVHELNYLQWSVKLGLHQF